MFTIVGIDGSGVPVYTYTTDEDDLEQALQRGKAMLCRSENWQYVAIIRQRLETTSSRMAIFGVGLIQLFCRESDQSSEVTKSVAELDRELAADLAARGFNDDTAANDWLSFSESWDAGCLGISDKSVEDFRDWLSARDQPDDPDGPT